MNIWTNGCFDILHIGHLNLLEFAKNFKGRHNTLYVGVDTDNRVKRIKGENRPINTQEDRKRMLEGLKVVDEVFIFDTDEELTELIKTCDIDYIIIGNDYEHKKVIGKESSKYGVCFFPKDEKSSSIILSKL